MVPHVLEQTQQKLPYCETINQLFPQFDFSHENLPSSNFVGMQFTSEKTF
jgi:hypothetical protein